MKNYKYYFFDLDGTLTQSEYGIFDSIQYALQKMGLPKEADEKKLRYFIGPPLFHSFQEVFGMSASDAEQAVVYYREYYRAGGLKNAPLYDGVERLLQELKDAGRIPVVVTAKPQELALMVLEAQHILSCFAEVVGPSPENKNPDKTWLIYEAMKRLHIAQDDAEAKAGIVMIGDRFYDIEAAVNAGVDSIGVLYGYGTREELESAGATYLVDRPQEIM